MEPRWLTAQEVADTIKVTRRTVYKLMRSGELKAAKIGSDWRVKSDVLQQFMDNGGKRNI